MSSVRSKAIAKQMIGTRFFGDVIYFAMGKIKRNTIVSHLIKLCGKDELIEKAYYDNKEIAWLSFSTDLNGKYVEKSFSFSRLLWAITAITKKKRKKELTFELDTREYDKLNEKYEQLLYEKSYPEFAQLLYTELYKEYIEYLNVPLAVDGVCALYRYCEKKTIRTRKWRKTSLILVEALLQRIWSWCLQRYKTGVLAIAMNMNGWCSITLLLLLISILTERTG